MPILWWIFCNHPALQVGIFRFFTCSQKHGCMIWFFITTISSRTSGWSTDWTSKTCWEPSDGTGSSSHMYYLKNMRLTRITIMHVFYIVVGGGDCRSDRSKRLEKVHERPHWWSCKEVGSLPLCCEESLSKEWLAKMAIPRGSILSWKKYICTYFFL